MGTIPDYDEDLDEAFSGPFDGTTFDDEDETYDDAYEAQTAILFNDGVMAPPSGDGPTSSTRGVGSDHTQLGVVPGTSNVEEVSGHRVSEPAVEPPQVLSAEFASSEEEARIEPDLTNPDGSPMTADNDLLNELQRVQM